MGGSGVHPWELDTCSVWVFDSNVHVEVDFSSDVSPAAEPDDLMQELLDICALRIPPHTAGLGNSEVNSLHFGMRVQPSKSASRILGYSHDMSNPSSESRKFSNIMSPCAMGIYSGSGALRFSSRDAALGSP